MSVKRGGLAAGGRCAALALTVWCVRAEENAVRNPGFEKTDAAGATLEWSERAPVYRFADGVGRGGMSGCLCIFLRLRGLAIIGYRRSAAGAKTLVVFQKLAAMGAKPGHDGSFHSMCWLDYKVVQVRLGRADPTGYIRIIVPCKPCRIRHNECGVLGVRRGRLSTAR